MFTIAGRYRYIKSLKNFYLFFEIIDKKHKNKFNLELKQNFFDEIHFYLYKKNDFFPIPTFFQCWNCNRNFHIYE